MSTRMVRSGTTRSVAWRRRPPGSSARRSTSSGKTVAVLAWLVLNATQLHLGFAWDVYPFIALNLLFSLQAAYAAPLILLAQTRQADRDKIRADHLDETHTRLERAAKAETDKLLELVQSNTDLTLQDKQLTEQVADLTKQIHALLVK
jgi:uncharacterized membrane protein